MIPLMEDPGGGGVHGDPSGPMDNKYQYLQNLNSYIQGEPEKSIPKLHKLLTSMS